MQSSVEGSDIISCSIRGKAVFSRSASVGGCMLLGFGELPVVVVSVSVVVVCMLLDVGAVDVMDTAGSLSAEVVPLSAPMATSLLLVEDIFSLYCVLYNITIDYGYRNTIYYLRIYICRCQLGVVIDCLESMKGLVMCK